MNCPQCSGPVQIGQRFCARCGTALIATCPRCKAEIASGQRFCGSCGHLAAAATVPGPLPGTKQPQAAEGDRRIVTVLFMDVSGFTSMSERLDPETVADIINNFFKVLVEPIYRYGGVVDKYIGDAIMALFGAPISHEDDAERAVRAAWEMQLRAAKYAADLESRTEIHLKVRIGLHTGLVVAGKVGSSQRADYTVMGDTVNLAQRMEASAKVGKVLVTAQTYQQAKDAFEFVA
ncbi:MAG: zinc ribbon domain-containing protein, partial [Cyanobacteria bacterium REEB65]|nr:zinc ribbon domain-containing protein [Cyanobacteria bacterium REEB65]